jgi:hypothetical protein
MVRDNVVRPFGLLGGEYRVSKLGLYCYRSSMVLGAVSVGAMAFARNIYPKYAFWVLGISLSGTILLALLAIANGERINRDSAKDGPRPSTTETE